MSMIRATSQVRHSVKSYLLIISRSVNSIFDKFAVPVRQQELELEMEPAAKSQKEPVMELEMEAAKMPEEAPKKESKKDAMQRRGQAEYETWVDPEFSAASMHASKPTVDVKRSRELHFDDSTRHSFSGNVVFMGEYLNYCAIN